MFVSKNHPDYDRLTAPRTPASPAPEPSGRLLLALPRPGKSRGPDGELRISLDEFQGHAYVAVRLWTRSASGEWFPSRKGCSIRMAECEDFAAALGAATRLAYATPARLGPR